LIISERIFHHHLNAAPGNDVVELVEKEQPGRGKEKRVHM
jgi:hypothetical protein